MDQDLREVTRIKADFIFLLQIIPQGRLRRWFPLHADKSSLSFPSPGCHRGLQPPRNLLEGQHSRNKQPGVWYDAFLLQGIKETIRRVAVLDLVLTNKEENVKLKGSLGWKDHEMLQFEILRAERRGHGKLRTVDSEDQTLASSATCLVESHKIKPWRREQPSKTDWYYKFTSLDLRSNASQWRGRQAKTLGGLCGWTRSSWTN